MTSAEIRQSFLDFFEQRDHRIVPSAPLLPTAPNLLFTNAGMNPFVPVFLGEQKPQHPRVADTQKCIRAGGKHNDLEDVGFDGYHQTFFEMLGNWSFGDYFKEEAITWAWELLTGVWGFPKERLYATVYQPGDGDPAAFDQEAYDYWAGIFSEAGLDPAIHIVNGNKQDNFWMMGDTGPCGPCSEIHVDLTPEGDTQGKLVNADSPWCIEVWNLVFIQFNATDDGQFLPLPARHVDTGMGFERIAGILATTQQFTDFSRPPSNYTSDLFTDLFDHIGKQCGKTYQFTLKDDRDKLNDTEKDDVAFRVLADHIRTLSCSVADGILPGNEGRHYVLRRILRRAVMYGKRLGMPKGFFADMVPPLVAKLGDVFPELKTQEAVIRKVITSEETAFEKTLDRGIQLLEKQFASGVSTIPGETAFELYDTYGFPLDLTELLARERGVAVDTRGFETHMTAQKERARAAQKKEAVTVAGATGDTEPTRFTGFALEDEAAEAAEVLEVVSGEDGNSYAILDRSPFYAEMGGQIGDTGHLQTETARIPVLDTTKDPQGRFLHRLGEGADQLKTGDRVGIVLDADRRRAIERHHTATHLLNWALRTVLGNHVRQAGSYVGPDRLRFDFNHFEAVTGDQLAHIEQLVRDKVLRNDVVVWYELPMSEKPDDVVAVFGEKYGNEVRVVDIGADATLERGDDPQHPTLRSREKPGYSAELCGGTHVRFTGEIGAFKIVAETAIAAGTRRIEAVAGHAADRVFDDAWDRLHGLAATLSCKPEEVGERLKALQQQRADLEKQVKQQAQRGAAAQADDLAASAIEQHQVKWVRAVVSVDNPKALRPLAAQVLGKLGDAGVVVLAAETGGGKVSYVALCGDDAVKAGTQAGDLVRKLADTLGGKGGGKPDFAMGGAAAGGDLQTALDRLA
ncbi:MAG: alanine--tRNA ligase [Opitutales bacterium]